MHSHALHLPYLLELGSSVVDALDMHPLPMPQNGAEWDFVDHVQADKRTTWDHTWGSVSTSQRRPMRMRWHVLELCEHWACACTSNDVAQPLMCLVKVRLKSGYTKHLDLASSVNSDGVFQVRGYETSCQTGHVSVDVVCTSWVPEHAMSMASL
jgi:hypothetical protein